MNDIRKKSDLYLNSWAKPPYQPKLTITASLLQPWLLVVPRALCIVDDKSTASGKKRGENKVILHQEGKRGKRYTAYLQEPVRVQYLGGCPGEKQRERERERGSKVNRHRGFRILRTGLVLIKENGAMGRLTGRGKRRRSQCEERRSLLD